MSCPGPLSSRLRREGEAEQGSEKEPRAQDETGRGVAEEQLAAGLGLRGQYEDPTGKSGKGDEGKICRKLPLGGISLPGLSLFLHLHDY